MGERKWYIWSFGWEGKEVRFWRGQDSREPKINFPIWRENLRNFGLFCFSLYNYIFILSPHLQCSTLQLLHLSFDLFCFLLSFLSSFAGFFFFLKNFNVTFLSSYNNIHCLYIHVLCYSFSISKGPWFFFPNMEAFVGRFHLIFI